MMYQVWVDLCMEQIMLLCCWKQCYASLDESVREQVLLCYWKWLRDWTEMWDWKCSHMLLKTILCKFGRICARASALMPLETILCEFGQICARASQKCSHATGNSFIPVWTDLCNRKCSFMWVWMSLCYRKCFCKTLLAGIPFWILPPKFEQECAEPFYVLMTHHTA